MAGTGLEALKSAIATRVATITTGNGYVFSVKRVVTDILTAVPLQPAANLPLAFVMIDPARDLDFSTGSGMNRTHEVAAPFTVEVWRQISKNIDPQTVANETLKTLIKMIFVDESWGGLAEGGTALHSAKYDYGEALVVVTLNLTCIFSFDEDNP